MLVEPVEVDTDRAQPDQRDRVASLREHAADVVEAPEQARGHGGLVLHGTTVPKSDRPPSPYPLLGATTDEGGEMRRHRFAGRRFALGAVLTLAAALALGTAVARSGVPGTYTVNALNSGPAGRCAHRSRSGQRLGDCCPTDGAVVGRRQRHRQVDALRRERCQAVAGREHYRGAPTGIVFNGGGGFTVTGPTG